MKTLADVAAEVGVSQATVSRVLNGKPGVSDDTRQAVLNTAKSMGITSTVGRNQPRHVAVVTPNLVNPVFASLLTDGTQYFAFLVYLHIWRHQRRNTAVNGAFRTD